MARSIFDSFQSGLATGRKQRQERQQSEARSQAADMFKSGNYEGAEGALMSSGLLNEASYFANAGARKKEQEQRAAYADAYKQGGYSALGDFAGGQGDFATHQMAQQATREQTAFDTQQKAQARQAEIAAYNEPREFFSKTAQGLKGHPPEQRAAIAIQQLQNSPFADEKLISTIQQAGADGKITDEELDRFSMMMAAGPDQMKMMLEQEKARQIQNHGGSGPRVVGPGGAMVDNDGTVLFQNSQRPTTFNQGGVRYSFDPNSNTTKALGDAETVGSNKAIAATIQGEEAARLEAAQDLPRVQENTRQVLDAVDALLTFDENTGDIQGTTKGFQDRYGAITSEIKPIMPGKAMDAQGYLNQIQGQAFLQAFQSLKGGGHITEVEGEKATQAITRLGNYRMSDEEAQKALLDLRKIATIALEKAQRKASGQTAGYSSPEQSGGSDLSAFSDEELYPYMTPEERALFP